MKKATNILIVFLVVQVGCLVAFAIFGDAFPYGRMTNIQALLRSIPPLAVISIGVGLLMICGEFDLSVGSNFALSAYVMAMTHNMGLCTSAAIPLALGTGAAIGLVNGLITLKARIPSFIATLGAMMFWRGVLLALSQGRTQAFRPDAVTAALFGGAIGPKGGEFVQAQFLWAVVVAVLAYLLLQRHKFGNHIFGVGGNRETAIAIGVNPVRVKMVCFVIVGFLAALAGILSATRVASVSPEQGSGFELRAIAACVVGGLSLMGGEGTILGIFLGASLLFTIQNVLLLLRVSGMYLDAFVGILIVVAVILNRLSQRNQE